MESGTVTKAVPHRGWLSRSLLSLVAGQFISMLGIHMSIVAIPWFVLETTGSPGLMAVVLIAETVPFAVLGIPSGVLVDRVNLKWMLVWLDVGRGLAISAIPVLALLDRLDFWMIVVAAGLNATLSAPYLGGRLALIASIVGEHEDDLTRANTMMQMSLFITMMLGPVLAGVLIPIIGNVEVILVDAVTYLVAAGVIAIGVSFVRPERHADGSHPHMLAAITEGLGYARRSPLLRWIVIVGVFLGFGFWTFMDAALPVFTKQVLLAGPEALGWMFGVWGAGAMLGMVVYSALKPRWPWRRGPTFIGTLVVLALPLWIPPLTQSYYPTLAALFVVGVADGPLTVQVQTLLQQETPANLRGRIFTAFQAITTMAAPLALAIAAPILEGYGSIPVMWAMAVLFTGCALWAWSVPDVRAA